MKQECPPKINIYSIGTLYYYIIVSLPINDIYILHHFTMDCYIFSHVFWFLCRQFHLFSPRSITALSRCTFQGTASMTWPFPRRGLRHFFHGRKRDGELSRYLYLNLFLYLYLYLIIYKSDIYLYTYIYMFLYIYIYLSLCIYMYIYIYLSIWQLEKTRPEISSELTRSRR